MSRADRLAAIESATLSPWGASVIISTTKALTDAEWVAAQEAE